MCSLGVTASQVIGDSRPSRGHNCHWGPGTRWGWQGLDDRVQVGGGASLDWLTAGAGKPGLASSPQHSQSQSALVGWLRPPSLSGVCPPPSPSRPLCLLFPPPALPQPAHWSQPSLVCGTAAANAFFNTWLWEQDSPFGRFSWLGMLGRM